MSGESYGDKQGPVGKSEGYYGGTDAPTPLSEPTTVHDFKQRRAQLQREVGIAQAKLAFIEALLSLFTNA